MNKLFTKIAALALGMTMAIGVGVAVGTSAKAVEQVNATEEVYKTALFGSSYNSQSVSGYTSTWTATNDGFTVTLVNFNNNNNGWNYVKCGRKNNDSVGTITTSAAIDKAVTKVVLTVDALTASKVNSMKLYSSSNGSSWTEKGSFDKSTGAKEVDLSSSATANLYYKIEIDCASSSSNGLATISKVEYYYDNSTPTPSKTPTETTVSVTPASIEINGTATLSSSVTYEGGSISSPSVNYSTDDNEIISISGNEVTGLSAGTATIKGTYAGDDDYEKSSGTTTIKVVAEPPYDPTGTNYRLITDSSDLVVNEYYLIGNSDGTGFMSSTQNTNNRGYVGAASVEGKISYVSGMEVIKLGKTGNNWTFYTTQSDTKGYLYAASGSTNHLKTQTANDANGEWTISIDSTTGEATLVAQGTNSRNLMRFNSSNNPPIFSCYGSSSTTGTLVSLWKQYKLPSQYTVTFNSDGGSECNPVTVDRGESFTLPAPTKTDYYFLGWKVFRGGEVVGDLLNGSYTPTDDVTLKAIWAYNVLSVTYDSNTADSGSAPTDGNVYQYNGTVTVLGNTGEMKKSHHSFAGWNTAADGSGVSRSVGSTFTIQENVTLYAVWTPNSVISLRNVDGSVPAKTEYSVNESFDPTGLVIYATYQNEGEIAENIASQISWGALVADTTTVTGTYGGASIKISGLTIYTPGTEDHPYTVEEARDAATATSVNCYVKGIIYEVASYSTQYSSITYWISDNGQGSSGNKDGLQIYSGKGLNGADFSSIDDLKVGWEVTINGDLKIFSSTTYELDKNSIITSIKKPVTELLVDPNELIISSNDLTAHSISIMIDEEAADQKVNISHSSGTAGLFTPSANQIECTEGVGSFNITGTGATEGSETFTISSNSNPSVSATLSVTATNLVYNTVSMDVAGYHLTGTTSVPQGEDVDVTIVAEAKYILPTSISVLDENEQPISEDWAYENGELLIESLTHNVHISFDPALADRVLVVSSPKTQFIEGDPFTTGNEMVVSVIYDDEAGTSEVIPEWDGEHEDSGYVVNSSAYNPNKAGTYTIVVTYDGLSDSYDVTVTGVVRYSYKTNDTFDNTLIGAGSSYSDWNSKSTASESLAVYAGNSASPTTTNEIQLRSSNSNSGIVSTTSGGLIKKVSVEWGDTLSTTRTLDIYGSNKAFTSATELYNVTSDVVKLGSITFNEGTEFTVTNSYRYVGVRSNSGALYLNSISFDWEEDIAADADVTAVNNFINSNMHPEIEQSNKGTGLCKTAGWYSAAKTAFGNLSNRQKAIVLTSSSFALTYNNEIDWYYNQIKERLSKWAKANSETFNELTGEFTKNGSLKNIFIPNEFGSSNAIVICAIVSVISVSAIGGYFFLRKRREEN